MYTFFISLGFGVLIVKAELNMYFFSCFLNLKVVFIACIVFSGREPQYFHLYVRLVSGLVKTTTTEKMPWFSFWV